MNDSNLRKDLNSFQLAVKKLSLGVGKASTLWKDKKYSELSYSVSQIAIQSKDVLLSGDKCCSRIAKFQEIASEQY